jgi:hypothetical protein
VVEEASQGYAQFELTQKGETRMSKWNSRKFAALMVTLLTNLLVWGNVESETAQAFASAAVNLLTLGYIIVQGWVDGREQTHGK